MRKNSIRKLIHGILDLLPLFVIPIFAININQKEVEPISIEVQEDVKVPFNQLLEFKNLPNTYDKINSYEIKVSNDVAESSFIAFEYTFNTEHKYVYKIVADTNNFRTSLEGNFPYIASSNIYAGYSTLIDTPNSTLSKITLLNTHVYNTGNTTIKANLYDLTQIFGSGNEPTLQEFNTYFNDYYNYTLFEYKSIGTQTITYDNTDIGSQFLYSLYISTDKYFNMNNVFNLNSVYQWFEINIFGGTAPLSIYIVWNIIIYELVMDLLMLLYALFMFFIDMCQKLIDKPLNSIK